jgi:hypothetical protein
MAPPFTRVPGTNLLVGNFGAGTNSRVVIFATPQTTFNDTWQKIDGTTIIVAGQETREALRELFERHSIRQVRDMLPGGLSGSTAVYLRQWLRLP